MVVMVGVLVLWMEEYQDTLVVLILDLGGFQEEIVEEDRLVLIFSIMELLIPQVQP